MVIAYDMFDNDSTGDCRSSKRLEGLYHKGHRKSWDGEIVLKELIDKHGGINIDKDKLAAIGEIFNVILWGELAAWKVSLSLSSDIENMEAKMAATSQAHDEARHFYTMKNYLDHIGHTPEKVGRATEKMLNAVMNADSLGKKLLGMQLMVEPVAITIFRFIRESEVEPVLCELLGLYEADEARHIALGVCYLPEVLKKMSFLEKVSLGLFQLKLLFLEVEGLRGLSSAFKTLNIDPHKVYEFAERKQSDALNELARELGIDNRVFKPVIEAARVHKSLAFSDKPHFVMAYNVTSILRRILLG